MHEHTFDRYEVSGCKTHFQATASKQSECVPAADLGLAGDPHAAELAEGEAAADTWGDIGGVSSGFLRLRATLTLLTS